MIPHNPFENHHRSIFRSAKLLGEVGGDNRIVGDAEEIACPRRRLPEA